MFAPRYYAPRYFAPRFFPAGGDIPGAPTSGGRTEHRFRSVVVPDFRDVNEVQRFLQRLVDEIGQAANPVRSVADGGTGLDTLETDKLMAGAGDKAKLITIGAGLELVDGVLRVATVVVGTDHVIDGVDNVLDGANQVVP